MIQINIELFTLTGDPVLKLLVLFSIIRRFGFLNWVRGISCYTVEYSSSPNPKQILDEYYKIVNAELDHYHVFELLQVISLYLRNPFEYYI